MVKRFPGKMPDGVCWAPFEASYTGQRDAVVLPPMPSPVPKPLRVPFGRRLWGSPMPTLDSYQRLIRALKPLGINTIVVQPSGWPDLPDAAARCPTALDIAYSEGIFPVLYAGTEMAGHLPAPLTENHKVIVAACDNHPGLLGRHLYNQLASKLTPEPRKMVEDQTRRLSGPTKKAVGHEIVGGHVVVAIPDNKVHLIRDCKGWGMSVIASDYAPIGGWSKVPDLSRWEGRFRNLRLFGLPTEAVLQAHVPLLDPAIPTAAEVRNQFWCALAGGARAFYFETACLYTHFSFRGILSWDLQPVSDGRYEEIRELAKTTKRLETVTAESEPVQPDGFTLDPPNAAVALRLRKAKDARRWIIERTNAWPHGFGRLVVRPEYRADIFTGIVHLVWAMVTLRRVFRMSSSHVGELHCYAECVTIFNVSNNEVDHCELDNSVRYAITVRGDTGAQYGPPVTTTLPPAKGNWFHHIRVSRCGQDSGDMGALHTANLNNPGGGSVNTFEQIVVSDTRATPSMKDWPPDGIFLDWPKMSMDQIFRHAQILNLQAKPLRCNGRTPKLRRKPRT